MYQRQEKSEKTTSSPKNHEDFNGVSNIPGIKSAKKKVLITKINNERGEIMTSRKGIANVFGEFYKKTLLHNEQDECGNESNIDVHVSDTEETTRIPEITSEELQDAIRKLRKKVDHQTAIGFEQKTSKFVTKRRKKL